MKRFGAKPLTIAIALWAPVVLAIPPAHEISELPDLERPNTIKWQVSASTHILPVITLKT